MYMNQEIDYYSKYLKYKIKYLNLKSELDGGENELSWKNMPKFVPKFWEDEVHVNEINCDNKPELKIYGTTFRNEYYKLKKALKFKWCDDKAKEILSHKLVNKDFVNLINSLFTDFIGKIYNIESDGKKRTLFRIEIEADKAKFHIKLDITHGEINRTKTNFDVFWTFFDEKTKKEELFDEKRHFKDGFISKVKKATIDGKEIDIDKFKDKCSDFKLTVHKFIQFYLLEDYNSMIYIRRGKKCTKFLNTFKNFWQSSHSFYESIIKK